MRLIYGSYPDVVTHPGDETERIREIGKGYLYKDILGNYILNFFSCSTVPSCVLANLRKMPGEICFACLRQDVFSGALPPRHARHSALSVGIRSHFVLPGGRPRGGSCAVNAA